MAEQLDLRVLCAYFERFNEELFRKGDIEIGLHVGSGRVDTAGGYSAIRDSVDRLVGREGADPEACDALHDYS